MGTPCLRCQKPLEEQQVDTVLARFCCDCKGMLLAHADLSRVLEESWRHVTPNEARELMFHRSERAQTEAVFHCPDCAQPMEKYGYMGWSAIPIDRCDRCSLVWLDSDELQNMILALAKSNYIRDRDRKGKTADSMSPRLERNSKLHAENDCSQRVPWTNR